MNLQVWAAKGMEKLRSFGVKEWGMLLIAGVCCLVIVFPTGKEKTEETQIKTGEKELVVQEAENGQDYVTQMEHRLTELLSSVEEVGQVKVMITVAGTTTKNVLQDGSREKEQSIETDSAGGTRNSVSERSEGTTVFYDTNGENTPYILNELYPKIMGVVVIAEGSGTGTVDLDILNAVQVLFDVPAHKIRIMKMK